MPWTRMFEHIMCWCLHLQGEAWETANIMPVDAAVSYLQSDGSSKLVAGTAACTVWWAVYPKPAAQAEMILLELSQLLANFVISH